MVMHKHHLAAAVVTSVLFSLLPATEAATVLALSLEELVTRADTVVVGRAVEVKTHRDERGAIVRSVELAVDELVAGRPAETVTVRLEGGVLDGVGRRVPGETELAVGETSLLFLEGGAASAPSELRVVGLSQGRFGVVVDAASGARFVTRCLGDVHLVGTPGEDRFGLARSRTSHYIPFDEFVRAVREIATVE